MLYIGEFCPFTPLAVSRRGEFILGCGEDIHAARNGSGTGKRRVYTRLWGGWRKESFLGSSSIWGQHFTTKARPIKELE